VSGIGCGTVFKVTPSGTETVLYSFTGGSDGGFPHAGLIAALITGTAGKLYGMTIRQTARDALANLPADEGGRRRADRCCDQP
jgi:hypothetical protein